MPQNTLSLLEYEAVLERLAEEAHSEAGRRACRQLAPNLTPAEILEAWSLMEEAIFLLQTGSSPDLAEHLDLAAVLKPLAAEGARLEVEDLRAVAYEARCARAARNFFQARAAETPLLAGLTSGLEVFPALIEDIERTIGPDGEILDGASPELARIRLELGSTRQGLTSRLAGLMRSESFRPLVRDELITTRADRYVIPVRASAAGGRRGLVHDWSQSGQTAYLEPLEAVEDNNKLGLLRQREKREIDRILRRLSAECRQAAPGLLASGLILTGLDRILASARLARLWSAGRPEYRPGQGFRLLAARHPLLLSRLAEKGERMTPLDLAISPEGPLLVISGLNTGGKTVAMKTLGLNVLMAKTGLPVLAAEGSFMDFPDQVLAVMGDEQDLAADLSTFSGHVRSLNHILESAGPGVLILLDELGAGTDPAEGAALGLAVLERLRPSGALILTATHYQLIKTWAVLTPGVVSAAVNASSSGRPLYGLSYGSPGFSGGLKMARHLGLPEDLVDQAESYLDDGQRRAIDLLARLDEERAALVRTRRSLEDERLALARTETELRAQTQKQLETARHQAREQDREVREALRYNDAEFKRLKMELESRFKEGGRADLLSLSQRKTALEKKLRAARPAVPGALEEKPLTRVEEGQEVFLKKLGRPALVRAVNERGEVWVDAEGLNIKTSLNDLYAPEALPGRTDKSSGSRVQVTVSPAEPAGPSLNLLGQTVDEALLNIERELDQAFRQSRRTLTIIHGYGTGRLRNGIRNFLKNHPLVRNFDRAPQTAGGDGVTIVELNL